MRNWTKPNKLKNSLTKKKTINSVKQQNKTGERK